MQACRPTAFSQAKKTTSQKRIACRLLKGDLLGLQVIDLVVRRRGRVLGAGVGENSVPVSDLDPAQPSVLVVGSEGEGLRTTVKRACDALVQVGSAPDNSGVDSLNVGVAGAILLHHLLGGAPK